MFSLRKKSNDAETNHFLLFQHMVSIDEKDDIRRRFSVNDAEDNQEENTFKRNIAEVVNEERNQPQRRRQPQQQQQQQKRRMLQLLRREACDTFVSLGRFCGEGICCRDPWECQVTHHGPRKRCAKVDRSENEDEFWGDLAESMHDW